MLGENLHEKYLDDPMSLNKIWKFDILLPFSTGFLKLENLKANSMLCRFIFVKFVCFLLDWMSMDFFTDW